MLPLRTVIGVDIGASGGMVYNYNNVVYGISSPDLFTLAKGIKNLNPVVVYAENVHAFKGQGIVSTGKLIKLRGQLEGACAALDIDLKFIEPEKWIDCFTMKRSKHFETSTGNKSKRDWKKHLLSIAKERSSKFLVNEITLETADAYLIWEYAINIVQGTPLKSKGTLVL